MTMEETPAHEPQPASGASLSVGGAGGLTLVLGPPNSGKLGELVGWWRSGLPSRPLVVTPTAAVAQEVTAELVRRQGALVGQAPSLTFDGLVREVLGEGPRYLSRFQSELILAGLVRGLSLPSLSGARAFPGFVGVLESLLRRLMESGRAPGDIDDLLQTWARVEQAHAGVADDLRRVTSAYAAVIASLGVVDRAAAVTETCAHLGGWTRPVALYGFTSFTGGQRRLVEALAAGAPVLMTLDYDYSRGDNLVTADEVRHWEAVACRVVRKEFQPQAYSSPSIAHLARPRGGTEGDAPVSESGYGVRFLLASGERSEAEAAARHVVDLIRDGFRPQDIAVVVRHVPARSRSLEQVFSACGIPYHIYSSERLAETGLGHAFLDVLKSISEDDPAPLLSYLKTPYSGADWAEMAHVERSLCAVHNPDTVTLMAAVERLGQDILAPVRGLSETLYAWQNGVAPDTEQRVSLSASVVQALQTVARRMLENGLRGYGVEAQEPAEDARAYTSLSQAFAEVERTLPFVHVDLPSLLGCLGRLPVSRNPGARRDAVTILSPSRARARRFGAVFILGLVEGEFPGRPDRPCLLTEPQRRGLEAVAGETIVDQEDEDDEALFASAVSRPWQVLYLSARDADDDGTPVEPSRFWTEAQRRLGVGREAVERRNLAEVVFDLDSAPAPRYIRRARALAARAPGGRDLWHRPAPRLYDPVVLEDFASQDCFSPSALEAYLSCPFAWFVERVVRVDSFEEQLDGRVIGELLHTALSRAYDALLGSDRSRPGEEDVSGLMQVVTRAVNESLAREDCPGTPADKRIASWRTRNLARTALLMDVAAGGRLVCTATEVPVGGADGVDVGGLRLHGRVDRIDVDPVDDSLFVIDYKSGDIPSTKNIGAREAIQLPLYLLALRAERPQSSLLGGAYMSPSKRKYSGLVLKDGVEAMGATGDKAPSGYRVLSSTELDELLVSTCEVAKSAAAGMRDGAIAPLDHQACPPWCDLHPLCRVVKRGGRR